MNSIRAFIQGRSKHNTTRTNSVLPAGITFVLPALTINLSLSVGTTYLPAGTFTLPVGTTYLPVVTIYYKIPNTFSHKIEKVKDVLGLIHIGVCGPLSNVSKKGASYFITFTDDYSRYSYVYLLKHKHEVFETFKVFKNEVENQLGKTIKAIRSDRGGEYISQEFKDYLKAYGIVQQLTPPYTPQHNGVSERRNRTLLNMVQSMMSLTTLPLSFWDYALESLLEHSIKEESLALIVSQEEDVVPVRRSVRTHKAPNRLCLNVEIDPDRLSFNIKVDEHSLGDLNELANYKAALSDPKFEKWLVAMNEEMQSMNDNKVWKLVNPDEAHWAAVKNILKYLRNTKDTFLVYGGNLEAELQLYGKALNKVLLHNMTAASEAAKEVVWIRKFIDELGVVPSNDYPIR
ncbi:retrotransposon protein, putative, ty1-copia subclass [Tanacetum coccineum]